MFCEEALTPSDIPMCDLFWGGIPCKFLFCTFHVGIRRRFRWSLIIRLGYQACPSPIPKWYAHVWTHKKGESLAIFYFAFCNLELRGFGKRIRKRLLLVRLMFQEEMCTTFTKPHRCLLLAFNLQRHFQQDIDLVGCERLSWCVTLLKQKG